MLPTLVYAASLVPEITDTIVGVDETMRLGYNWKQGPFELIDAIGVDRFIAAVETAGIAVPPLLVSARGRSFYRIEGGQLQYLTTEGEYATVTRAPGVICTELWSIRRRPARRMERSVIASMRPCHRKARRTQPVFA